jgi:hypothetical protein
LVGVHAAFSVHALHVPLSHTSLTPHVVPFVAGIPVSVQLGVPPEQTMVPRSHALVGVHDAPFEQAAHVPFSQTLLVPHVAPLGRSLFVLAHTDAPLAQPVAHTVHEPVGVHTVPAVHGLQKPLRHTMLAPHVAPLARCVPVSVHTATPVEQSVVPVSHGTVGGVHAAVCVHALHAPLLHTSLVPHDMPLATLAPVSVHTATPVEQLVVPVWHGLLGTHAVPEAHAAHVPKSHTWPAPHIVPFGASAPVSVHVGVPPSLQSTAPTSHGSAGVHAAPGMHTPPSAASGSTTSPPVSAGPSPSVLDSEGASTLASVVASWPGPSSIAASVAASCTGIPSFTPAIEAHATSPAAMTAAMASALSSARMGATDMSFKK